MKPNKLRVKTNPFELNAGRSLDEGTEESKQEESAQTIARLREDLEKLNLELRKVVQEKDSEISKLKNEVKSKDSILKQEQSSKSARVTRSGAGSKISDEVFECLPVKVQTQILNMKLICENRNSSIPSKDYYACLLYGLIKEALKTGDGIISHDDLASRGIRRNEITRTVDKLIHQYQVIRIELVRVNGARKTKYSII